MKHLFLFALLLFAAVSPAMAQGTPTPEPIDPVDGFYSGLSDANSQLQGALNDPRVPNGLPALPDENAARLFKYVKWMISPAAAEDLFGPFAPIMIHLGIFIVASFAFIGTYITVYGVSRGVRLIIFLARFLMQLVSTLMEIITAIAQAGKAVISAVLAKVGIGL